MKNSNFKVAELAEKIKSGAFQFDLSKSIESMYSNYSNKMSRIDERYKSEHIHVSSMLQGNYCPLKQLFAKELNSKPETMRVDLGLQHIWGIGKSLEAINQDLTIESLGHDRIIGTYSCLCGKHEYSGVMLKDDMTPTCQYCGTKVNRYKELRLRLGVLNGSPDMIALYNNNKFTVTEYKSIKRDGFAELHKAELKHALQSLIYVEMLKLLTTRNPDLFDHLGINKASINYDSAVVIYTCKDYLGSFNSPVKVFEVSYNNLTDYERDTYNQVMSKVYEYSSVDDISKLVKYGGFCGDFKSIKAIDVYSKCEFYEHCKKRKKLGEKSSKDTNGVR